MDVRRAWLANRSCCEQLETRRLLAAVTVSGTDTGRIFDGVGALSNSSSRLLYDYPEPQRSQILDYLFKPGYGASLQILKTEIGGDTNSTDVAEPSHMRSPTDLNFTRGWEWWLMGQAKARNPNIKLYALEWGAPGWFNGGFYSQDNINYIMKFLDGAGQQGFNFDYVGGWNESVANPSTPAIRQWFINLKAALVAQHPTTKLVAYDDGGTNWRIGDDMVNYPDFGAAIDILGQHSPGVWRSLYQNYTVTANALSTGKPLWASEQSAESHDVGGPSWARGIIREYVQAKITAALAWDAVDSFYPSGNHADTGIILAENPWSGYYDLGSMVWVFAQTTQFTQPGWQYLDNACGSDASTGAYYVSLKSNTTDDYSTMVESMDATGPTTMTWNVANGLSTGTVHVWASNVATSTLSDDFLHVADLTPVGGSYSFTIQPGYVYTFSTTTGQGKGTAQPNASIATQMALPYSEDFESYGGSGKLARYWTDLQGAFETAPAGGGRSGTVYRQVVSTTPIAWGGGTPGMPPTSLMGDMRWWGDYQFSSDVLLEQSGYVELIGRIGGAPGNHVSGYHFQVNSSGAWTLYSEEPGGADTTLGSGTTAFALNTWHTMSLKMTGSIIQLILDGSTLTTISNNGFITGNVAIRASNLNGAYQNAQFDNITITRTSLPPAFVPHAQMTATASDTYSVNGGFYLGQYYLVSYAIDDRPESIWHSAFNPRVPPPHWYLIDMGSPQTIEGLVYQPRIDANNNGDINTYNVLLSNDGVNFTTVISGATWPTSSASKTASWPAQQARYVELYETAGVNGLMSIGELNVIQTRSTASAAPDLAAASDTGASSTDNLTSLNNSASAKKLQFTVAGTTAGSLVRLYADGVLIGAATASGTSTTVTTDGTTTLSNGAHVITATQQAATFAQSPASAGLTITIDTTAPLTTAANAALSGAIPLVNVSFSEHVVALDPADLTIMPQGGGSSFNPTAVTFDSGANTATFTLGSAVPDGIYHATLAAASVTDDAGNPNANASSVDFVLVNASHTFPLPAGTTTKVNTVLIASDGILDVGTSRLIVDYSGASPIAALASQIGSGRNGGDWSGSGIVTSAPTSANVTTLGIAEASQVLGPTGGTFGTQSADGTSVLIKYTYGGDANLDGKINVDDYGHIDASIALGIAGWFNGDFNYDGKINVDDYGIIDQNVTIQGPPLTSAAGIVRTRSASALALPPKKRTRQDSNLQPSVPKLELCHK